MPKNPVSGRNPQAPTGPIMWLIDGVECEIIAWLWLPDLLVLVPVGADHEDANGWKVIDARRLRKAGKNMRTFVICPKDEEPST